jgi:hypothetical protein
VLTNIVNNLDFEGWTDRAKKVWFDYFKSDHSQYVISDAFWYCICKDFKPGAHVDMEEKLYDRISQNYVALFQKVSYSRKDFFFRRYYDAISQAVLFSMFLAYPKSRVKFTDEFRRDLMLRFAKWTTGIEPEFVDTSHWKLNLGGGDVLQSTQTTQSSVKLPIADASKSGALIGRQRESLARRAPRPVQQLRYSPLVEHFLRKKRYHSSNLIQPLSMALTSAEERCKLMDEKHAVLVDRAAKARYESQDMLEQYVLFEKELKAEEREIAKKIQKAKKKLEIRRKEVLRLEAHEFANYLVSLNLLQRADT